MCEWSVLQENFDTINVKLLSLPKRNAIFELKSKKNTKVKVTMTEKRLPSDGSTWLRHDTNWPREGGAENINFGGSY